MKKTTKKNRKDVIVLPVSPNPPAPPPREITIGFKIGGQQHTLKVPLPPASSSPPSLSNILSFPEKK